MSIQNDLRRLEGAGVDCSCRCPKPCMKHSDYYRNEKLRSIENLIRIKAAMCPACGGTGKGN